MVAVSVIARVSDSDTCLDLTTDAESVIARVSESEIVAE